MWKTQNFFTSGTGKSLGWVPLTDFLATTSGGASALGLTNPSTIYFATGDPFGIKFVNY
jgi:hypothetical protein